MKDRVYTEDMGQPPKDIDGGSAPKPNKSKQKPKAKDKGMDKPIVESVRSGGKLVPRFARDMDMDEPIPRRGMVNKGSGLETVPDRYAKGGMVKRGWGKARCK